MLLLVGNIALFTFIAAFISTGGALIGISLDVPGRYYRTEGICTVKSGTYSLSPSYDYLFMLFILSYLIHPIPSHPIPSHPIPSHPIPSHPISSHLISSHLISSHFIYFILFYLLSLAFFLANTITADKLLRFQGKYSSTYKPLWAVTVFADDDADMTNPLFWSASSVENDISSPYLSSWYASPFSSSEKKKRTKDKNKSKYFSLLTFCIF